MKRRRKAKNDKSKKEVRYVGERNDNSGAEDGGLMIFQGAKSFKLNGFLSELTFQYLLVAVVPTLR